MTVMLWIAAIALIIVGVAGTVLPALPGAVLVFGTAVRYQNDPLSATEQLPESWIAELARRAGC